MNKTVGGGTISTVVKAESVDMNGAPVSTIFDGSTALVNGKVVGVSSDRTDTLVNEHPVIATVEGYVTRNLKLDNNTLNIINEEKHNGTIAPVNGNQATEISKGTDVITADGINNLEAVILEGGEVNGASVDVTCAGLVALVYNNLVKVSIKLNAENVGNPSTEISEGTDVITADAINNLKAVNLEGGEVNCASADVTYAGLVALLYNNLVKVSIKLDAENDGNTATEISEGTDVIMADGINNLEAVNLEDVELNGASADVTYAGLVALVYNNLVKVTIKLDAENGKPSRKRNLKKTRFGRVLQKRRKSTTSTPSSIASCIYTDANDQSTISSLGSGSDQVGIYGE